MAEFQVEQLARDAKVLQIYAGTDEIQITHIAKGPPPPVARAGRVIESAGIGVFRPARPTTLPTGPEMRSAIMGRGD
jgi:hypothetical protein